MSASFTRPARRADGRTAVLALGAASALIAAGAGLLLGGSGGYGGATFDWHQRMGVIVAMAIGRNIRQLDRPAGDASRPRWRTPCTGRCSQRP